MRCRRFTVLCVIFAAGCTIFRDAPDLTGNDDGISTMNGTTSPGDASHYDTAATDDGSNADSGIGGSEFIELSNSIVANNYGANIGSPQNCGKTHIDGGGNLQFPRNKDDGDPDKICAEGVLFADPKLTESADGLTYIPAPDSPAVGLGLDCAQTDQFGEPRPAQGCTTGRSKSTDPVIRQLFGS